MGLLAGLATVGTFADVAYAGDAPAPKAAADKPAAKPAGAAPAAKPDKKTADAARKAFGDGQKAFGAGDFVAAQASFQKANELIPSPQASYWIAKCIDGQNKTEDAIAAYEALLADPNVDKIGDEKRADAKARLDALKATLAGEVAVDTNPLLASIAVDGVAQPGEAPMTLKLSPGKHRITVSSKGYTPKDIDLDVKGGDKLKQSVILEKEAPPIAAAAVVAAPPPEQPPPPKPKEERSMVPAYVTLGIAGAGAIVGTIFGIQALNAKNDFNKTPTTELADKAERDALICDMAFGVAITLGVTGVVLLTSDDEPAAAAKAAPPKAARLEVAPYVGKKSGGAAAKLTF
ncbi:MAG TPA: PEGA domain-containing protein [Polyangiaceae bacterium]